MIVCVWNWVPFLHCQGPLWSPFCSKLGPFFRIFGSPWDWGTVPTWPTYLHDLPTNLTYLPDLPTCPKPSGQGFRPPQNQEKSSLKSCPKPSRQALRPPLPPLTGNAQINSHIFGGASLRGLWSPWGPKLVFWSPFFQSLHFLHFRPKNASQVSAATI